MKKHKNRLTIILMASSLVLLLALQVLWLTSTYEKAYYNLHERTTGLFRNAVHSVRDSLLFQKIEKIPNDSTVRIESNFLYGKVFDSVHRQHTRSKLRREVRSQGQVQVFVSGASPDTIKSILQPFASRMREGSLSSGATFTIRLDRDSLNIDSIGAIFSRNLANAGLDNSFEIKQEDHFHPMDQVTGSGFERMMIRRTPGPGHQKPGPVYGKTIQTDWIRVDPIYSYATVLSGIRPVLVKEISGQIFFSGVLTVLTSLSFLFMFRSIRSQQRLMVIKNDFISNITHELKTPIATVSVALEALKNFKGIDNPRMTGEYLDIAQHELGRLSLLTDKVLTTSLFEERGITMDFEKVDLEKIVLHILNSMKLIVEKQKAQIDFEKSGTEFVLFGNSMHLTNVVYNLLDNAIKYSPLGPMVKIELHDHGHTISLSVIDQGLGIPQEYQKKIFEKFFRMPTGDVHNIKGHGLGLNYVESVIKGHGGTVALKSEPGKGSTFTVTLPKGHA